MKRNDDLIRDLMLMIEDAPAGQPVSGKALAQQNFSDAEVVEHLQLLEEAGLIDLEVRRYLGDRGPQLGNVEAKRLTWAGHEFIGAIRSDTIWEQTKERTAKVGGSVSLKVLGEVAGSVAKGMLGLS